MNIAHMDNINHDLIAIEYGITRTISPYEMSAKVKASKFTMERVELVVELNHNDKEPATASIKFVLEEKYSCEISPHPVSISNLSDMAHFERITNSQLAIRSLSVPSIQLEIKEKLADLHLNYLDSYASTSA